MFTETLHTAAESILMMVLTVVIPVLLGYGATKFSAFIKAKTGELNSEYAINMFAHIADTIESVVNHTTQTYVQELKDIDRFDIDAQSEALQKTKLKAFLLLNNEAQELIRATHGDLHRWLETQVESVLLEQKLLKGDMS